AAKPLVGPRVNKRPGAARSEGSADLPVQHLRLYCFSVAQAVQSHLRHDQGSVARNVVQAGKVRIETLVRFQINVETGKIQEPELEIFGGWVIDVSHQPFGVLGLRRAMKPVQEPL